MKNKQENLFEIYIHIPFCVKKCEYCDFLSFGAGLSVQKRYMQALQREVDSLPSQKRMVSSVFIGGGTPSLVESELIGGVVDNLKKKYTFTPDAEITIEANPGTLTSAGLKCYKNHGINRLSIGLQSVSDKELKMLGRIHTFREFQESYECAREEGFSNINVDLMFALPGQTRESWKNSLKTVSEMGPEHISAYSLIIEEGTPFAARKLDLPDEETEYQMYEDTAKILREYGYLQYEISNYAKKEFACRHNIGYWKRTDYIGIGLGASSLFEKERFTNTSDLEEYLQFSSCPERIRKDREQLSVRDEMVEFMILGLRMTEGVSEKEFSDQFGSNLMKVYGNILDKYKHMEMIENNGDRWRFTRKGIHVSNRILADFL